MLYLSGLQVVTGVKVDSEFGSAVMFSGSVMSISDSESDEVFEKRLVYRDRFLHSLRGKMPLGTGRLYERVGLRNKLFRSDDILGTYISADNSRQSYCKVMTDADIKFHRFVRASETIGVDEYSFDGADVISPSGIGSRWNGETDTLYVLMSDRSIEVSGLYGSAACIRTVSTAGAFVIDNSIMSLRELILELCRVCKYNIMQYSCVMVISSAGPNLRGTHMLTEIRFDQSSEARRYLLKLGMLEGWRRN